MSTCATLESVTGHCGPNAPKLKGRIWLAREVEVEAIAPAVLGAVPTITLVDGAAWSVWDLSNVEPNFTATPEGDPDGLSIPYATTLFAPRMTPLKSEKFNKANGAQVIAIVEDRNGEKHILGEKGNGAYVTIGAQTSDKNGYPISIAWDAGRLAYHFTGSLPAPE